MHSRSGRLRIEQAQENGFERQRHRPQLLQAPVRRRDAGGQLGPQVALLFGGHGDGRDAVRRRRRELDVQDARNRAQPLRDGVRRPQRFEVNLRGLPQPLVQVVRRVDGEDAARG